MKDFVEHDRIYLQPACCSDFEREDRHWCQDKDVWEECEDAAKPVEFIRADLMPTWRPIETAPKDGTFVDLWDELSKTRLPNCCWDALTGRWMIWGGTLSMSCDRIKFWMPLPKPPEGE